MNEEKLLQDLAEIAREEEERELSRLDRRWDDLAAGALDATETGRLQEQSRESEELAEAFEAFRPLGPEFRSRMAEAARFQLAGNAQASREETRAPSGRVLRPRSWGGAGALVALAASLVFFVFWPSGQPPLPGYSMESQGNTREFRAERSGEPGELLLADGNRLQIILSPEREVEGELRARVDLWHQGSSGELGAPRIEISPQGAVRIDGTVGLDLTLPDGPSALIVVLGRPDSLPATSEIESRLGSLRALQTEQWIGWRIPVVKTTEGER